MTMGTQAVDFMDPLNKGFVLSTLQGEMDDTFAVIAESARWEASTACSGWEARDVIGHLVDATEGYFPNFEIARNGGTPDEPLGLAGMAVRADEHARAFRTESRDAMIERLRADSARAMGYFTGLSDEDWTGLIVSHPYMGPIPAMFYPMFQMVDYSVHTWDIREGMGEPHGLSGDAADLLVPIIFILWQATADTSAVTAPYSVGVRTSGRNGGDMRLDVSSDGVQFAPGPIDDCGAIIEFDPATLVLTGYGRVNGGTVRGDRQVASNFRSLFFPI
jgi:uncharacterized protein (TIGR03083 family)